MTTIQPRTEGGCGQAIQTARGYAYCCGEDGHPGDHLTWFTTPDGERWAFGWPRKDNDPAALAIELSPVGPPPSEPVGVSWVAAATFILGLAVAIAVLVFIVELVARLV